MQINTPWEKYAPEIQELIAPEQKVLAKRFTLTDGAVEPETNVNTALIYLNTLHGYIRFVVFEVCPQFVN